MSPVPGIPSDISYSTGPIITTFMLGQILYGVQILQVYLYYLSFPKDKPFVKAMVYTVFFLDTLQTVIFFRDAFQVFGYGFGDVANFKKAHLSGFSVPILTGMVSFIVQGFYAYQLRILSRSKILVGVIIAVSLIQLIASIVEGVLVFKINDLANLQRLSFIQCTVWLAGSALCDTIIAVAMTYYLMKASNGMKSTNLLIKRLIRLVIETGTATATVAIIDCILFVGVQRYPFHTLPSRCLAKVYANTLMVILNSRIRIAGSRDETKLNPSVVNVWSDIKFSSILSKQQSTAATSEETGSSGRTNGGVAGRIRYSTQNGGQLVPMEEMNSDDRNENEVFRPSVKSSVSDA
ncbi:hypothetical protein Moror_16474 [Moniliophthora roreri MCA 2997]|uniref:DUF6534 domain-containing protein n=2 Tax=Moniliophthora roreri TaxID=221103 RepID=V2WVK1_MONRO|nr:hypothetical protein Moror_16474 [Moniliophthora roreri MCA 2997]